MSEHNITVEGGSSVRLPTAGKYCDRDIVITAKGGSGGGQVYVDGIIEVNVGETVYLYIIGTDSEAGTPMIDSYDCGENPDIISVVGEPEDYPENLAVTGVSEGKTIVTYQYNTDFWESENNFTRVLHYQINVIDAAASDAEYQYEDTLNMSVGDTETVFMPCPYDSPGVGDYTVIKNGHLVSVDAWGGDSVDISANDTGTAVIRFDYGSYEPGGDFTASCTLILTINIL